MTLRNRGEYCYGDGHADVRVELARYADLNGYPIDDFVDVACSCGNDEFYLFTDETAGVAVRKCCDCYLTHPMGDSAEYADEADAGRHECICGEAVFQITAGVHRYRKQDGSLSNDVRWVYLGCRCPSCELVGCYADWKNEYNGYKKLLALM